MEERLVSQMDALDRTMAEMDERRGEILEEETDADREIKRWMSQLNKLRGDVDNVDCGDMRTSSIGSTSVESLESTLEGESPTGAGTGSSPDCLQFDHLDFFSYPAGIKEDEGCLEESTELSWTEMECFKREVASSEVVEEIMELLGRVDGMSKEADRWLSQLYLKTKAKSREDLETVDPTAVRFPLSECEEWKYVVGLWGEEFIFSMWNQLPDQSATKFHKPFIDKSRLVEDPEEEAFRHYHTRPWSQEEKEIFMEEFVKHPKDFYEIAKWLPNRTTGDCVQFFYANKKSELFESIRRKRQVKKRRLQLENNKEMISNLGSIDRKVAAASRSMFEFKRKKKLMDWLLERLPMRTCSFTDEALKAALRKFGYALVRIFPFAGFELIRFNYKAIAKEVGCASPSVIGCRVLLNVDRFNLHEFFASSSGGASDIWRQHAAGREGHTVDVFNETRALTHYFLSGTLTDARSSLQMSSTDGSSNEIIPLLSPAGGGSLNYEKSTDLKRRKLDGSRLDSSERVTNSTVE